MKTHLKYIYGTLSGWITDDEGNKIIIYELKAMVEFADFLWWIINDFNLIENWMRTSF